MKKIKMNAAKLQLNKTKIADLNNQEMMVINGGQELATTPGKVIIRPIQSVPFYITCRNCNPQTNSVGCCDNV